MLSQSDLTKLEKRAQSALSGYTADVNITCYVYGADVLSLVNEVRRLWSLVEEMNREGAGLKEEIRRWERKADNAKLDAEMAAEETLAVVTDRESSTSKVLDKAQKRRG